MRIIWLCALAAVLVSGTLLSGPVDAGNNKHKFGYPLGTFESSPHSGGSNHSGTNSYAKHKSPTAAQRRAAAKQAAARRAAAKRAAAKRAAAKQAAAKRAAAHRTTAGSKPTDDSTVANKTNGDDRSAPVKASAIAATNTLKFRPEPPADKSGNDDAAATTETADAESDTNACKKYIPSAGMTVSVPCGADP